MNKLAFIQDKIWVQNIWLIGHIIRVK